jgi:acetylornithine/N-succinyldiaminopimelate aminotransferase
MHINNRQLFLNHLAQTSPAPMGLEIVQASGIYLTDAYGKKYIDGISGFSVMNIGHANEQVLQAINTQASSYMHVMVYGEMVQAPQVQYAKLLTDNLPESLNCVYFTNSGAEATEGAMKLAKRVTGRGQIIAFNNAYHGSTQGALSIMGSEYWRNAYRPLLPGVVHADFNSPQAIDLINNNVACVIVEAVQAEAGVIAADKNWLLALRNKCTQTGTLLVIDEIQTGFGRTGSLWAFEQYGIVPDVLLLGKALGGGLPLGAFIANKNLMQVFTHNPVLGHISTFAGHPVSCAAGMAAFNYLLANNFVNSTVKQSLFKQHLPMLRQAGMLMAIEFNTNEQCHKAVHACIQNGFITDWFLFAPNCLRIAPPLTITAIEIEQACNIINEAML